MRSIEHIKRYTTTGMATDQGKTSNMNALAIAAESLGKPIAEVGLTTFRLPYTPVTFGAFGGLSRREHVRSRARDAAAFLVRRARARYSRSRASGSAPRACRCPARSREETIRRECLATRAKAGHHGCVDARQDRGRRTRRGGVSQSALRQFVHQARRRTLPLWADAERDGLRLRRRRRHASRRGPLPHHDDDFGRRARPSP